MIDLMVPDVRRKRFHYKHILFISIIVVILIVTIVLCVVSGKHKKEEKNAEQVANANTAVQVITQNQVGGAKTSSQTTQANNQNNQNNGQQVANTANEKTLGDGGQRTVLASMMPRLTDQAKERMQHIYLSDYKRVFLTFDDGPSKTVTPVILNILKQYQVKATFFVLGNRVDLYPNLLKQEYLEGHYIANHGYTHQYSAIYASSYAILDEFNQTENSIRNALNIPSYQSHLFRYPGGAPGGKYANVKKEAMGLFDQINVAHVDWSALTKDAEGKFSKEQLLQNLYETAQNRQSVVLLMHDAGDKQTTAEALPEVIQYFKQQGYVFENFYDIMK